MIKVMIGDDQSGDKSGGHKWLKGWLEWWPNSTDDNVLNVKTKITTVIKKKILTFLDLINIVFKLSTKNNYLREFNLSWQGHCIIHVD